MATEKVRATPEAAEALRKQIEESERVSFDDVADEYRGTSATAIADDSAFLKFGAVEHGGTAE